MGPEDSWKSILTINGEEIGTLGDFSLRLNEPTSFSESINTGNVTATISFKMNRWCRFKMWLWVQKQKFSREKSYSIELKMGGEDEEE